MVRLCVAAASEEGGLGGLGEPGSTWAPEWAGSVKVTSSPTPRCRLNSRVLFIDLFKFFWGGTAWLVGSYPGIEPEPPAVKVPSPHHWTTREFPVLGF